MVLRSAAATPRAPCARVDSAAHNAASNNRRSRPERPRIEGPNWVGSPPYSIPIQCKQKQSNVRQLRGKLAKRRKRWQLLIARNVMSLKINWRPCASLQRSPRPPTSMVVRTWIIASKKVALSVSAPPNRKIVSISTRRRTSGCFETCARRRSSGHSAPSPRTGKRKNECVVQPPISCAGELVAASTIVSP